MSADLQNPIFTDETAARDHLEAIRWPEGPICPHCGNSNQERVAKVQGEKQSHRPGLFYCNECKGQFTVTVGTVFELSLFFFCCCCRFAVCCFLWSLFLFF